MKKIMLLTLVSFTALFVSAQTTNAPIEKVKKRVLPKIKVTGDRVSLRAKPEGESEILDRAMHGDEFVLLGETNGWMAVQAPDTIDFWVFGTYLKDGVVQPKKLNVRSGPNQNYSVMYVAKRDEKLRVRGASREWTKVAPMAGAKVWISAKYVKPVVPPKPKKEVAKVVPVLKETKKPVAVTSKKEKEKPLVLVLDKSKEQGIFAKVPGVLRNATPGLYKLVLVMGDDEETICLVRGNERQLNHYLNRSLLLEGKKYWAKDVEWPILNVSKIYLNPIIKE